MFRGLRLKGSLKRMVGVFDSGVGGLTVAKKIIEHLPNESILYLGDTARVPYGNRSKDIIIRYSLECVDFLVSNGVKCVVVACNTASAIAMSTLKEAFSVPILGVIEAGSKMAVLNTKSKNVGIIGTRRTIESNAYKNTIGSIDSDINVIQKETPLLVPLVEENFYYHKATEMVISEYLCAFVDNIDALILGCTHYPVLYETISNMYPHLSVIDPAVEVALDLKQQLTQMDTFDADLGSPTYKFCVTDYDKDVLSVARSMLGDKNNDIITHLEEVRL